VKFVAENVAIGGEDFLFGVFDDGVVAVEAVLLVFDEFFAAEVVDGGAEDGLLCFSGIVGELSC